ncbi:PHB depolymerase family esterase [Hymenobacter metallicola]|nr:PHB depolymerase family esterase [Hymenobacter metallicola]
MGLLTGPQAHAQAYDQLLESAARQLGQKNYCAATASFAQAFADTTQAGPFDLYAGAGAAANCPGQQTQALRWLLRITRAANLPITSRDVDQMAQDAAFSTLHNFPEWSHFLASLRQTAAQRVAEAQRAAAEWQSGALRQALPLPAKPGRHAPAQSGFALYYAPVDTVRVPYLVYVPKTYQPGRRTALLVYLHGGVVNTTQFQAADPGVVQEPIFAAAAALQTLVLYPFGRQSFGWLEQRAALENVRTMVEQVKQRYNIDSRRVYLGGMSNGGSAALWYACQSPTGFAGFFAVSALPAMSLGPLNFKQLNRGAPLYSLHAPDDQVAPYHELQALYAQQGGQVRHWHLVPAPAGGHAFLYGPKGLAALQTLLNQLMQPAP